MVWTTINEGIDTLTNWTGLMAGDKKDSTDNPYLDWLNDMRVGFYESGDYGGDWAGGGSGVNVETTFPDTPSNGVLFVRYNTVTNILRGYRYDGSGWITIGYEDKQKFFNGTFLESFTALVTSDGAIVTLTVQQDTTGDLTMRFSDGETTLDCTPALTIELTVGTDKAPTLNYIYVLQSTKVLTLSTSGWPATEYIKIGKFLIPSAAFVSANGSYTNHNFNDHAFGTDNQGHGSHLGERSRKFGAVWDSGVAGDGTTDYLTIAGATVTFKSTVGVVYQMHSHVVSAFDSSATKMLVVNEPGTSYNDINNLYDLTQDSASGTLLNKWFNLIIIGVANQSSAFSAFLINLPGGTYVTQAQAEDDTMNFNNYDIPGEFIGVAFLICRITVQKTGSTFTYGSFKSLLGVSSQIAGGSSFSTLTEFLDSQFKIQNAADPTKEIDFDASGISPATTRTITMPDVNVTLHNIFTPGVVTAHTDISALGGTPVDIGTSNNAGSGSTLLWHNHVHKHPSGLGVSLHHTKYTDEEAVDAIEDVSAGVAIASDTLIFSDAGVLKQDAISDILALADTGGSVKGEYIVIMSPYADDVDGAWSGWAGTSWGGGDTRYISFTNSSNGMFWNFGTFVPAQVAGNSVRVDSIEAFFWAPSRSSGSITLGWFDYDRTNVNASEIGSSTSSTWVFVASSTYKLMISPGNTINTGYNYTMRIRSLPISENCRPMGFRIKYTVL